MRTSVTVYTKWSIVEWTGVIDAAAAAGGGMQVCEYRVSVDWDTAVAAAPSGESDTSLYVSEAVGEVVSDLECMELVTPGKRELDAERRVAAPATGVARHVSAEEVYPLTVELESRSRDRNRK